MPRFIVLPGTTISHNVDDIAQVSGLYMAPPGFYFMIHFKSNQQSIRCDINSEAEFDKFGQKLIEDDTKEYRKEKLRLMERYIKAVEENTLALTYAPGGPIETEAAKDFAKKASS